METNSKELNQRLLDKKDAEYDIENQIGIMEFSKVIRLNFIRKVYAILTAQLMLTSIFIIFSFNETINNIYRTNSFLFITSAIFSLVIAISLICFSDIARKVPLNYILLTLWTLCEGYLVGCVSAYFTTESVLLAAALTITVTLALTVYAFTTKTDITYFGGLLFVLISIMLFLSIFFLIFGINSQTFPLAYTLYCVLGIFVYSIYLIYDTQLLIGKFSISYSIDDYVLAVMMIYIDIIQIFLYILELLGRRVSN